MNTLEFLICRGLKKRYKIVFSTYIFFKEGDYFFSTLHMIPQLCYNKIIKFNIYIMVLTLKQKWLINKCIHNSFFREFVVSFYMLKIKK